MNTAPPPFPIRPAARLAGLTPYAPPKPAWEIDLHLDANEGPCPSPELMDAMGRVMPESIRRYPDASALEARIAERWAVDPTRVVVTNGGDDAIDRVCRAVLEPGRTMVWHTPGFEMIERSARLAGAEVRAVPWTDGPFPADRFIEAMDATTGLVALVSPNNPTGGVITVADMVRIGAAAEGVGAVAMIDLAYAEFADADPTPAMLELSNAVIIRTFSKAMGLAGMRVGYAIAPAPIARWVRTVGGPYPVSGPALAVAAAAWEPAERTQGSCVDRVRTERAELSALLRDCGARVLDSQANFVTARFRDAALVRDGLASLGIAVRGFASRPELSDALRITLPGNAGAFDRVRSALRTAMRPDALLLDLDGVIANVSGSYRAAIVATARTYGVSVTADDIAQAKRAGNANNDWVVTHRLIAARGVACSLEEVTARFQSVYLGSPGAPGLRERESLIPSRALLHRLAGRLPMAIVTGRPRPEAAWFLDRAGIADLIRAVVCMEDGPAKPAPDPVRLAMERLGARSAWMVGDTPDDVRASRAAGALGIGIPAPTEDPVGARESLRAAGSPRVISELAELERMLP
jgi:histidinol-phosphate aminotransferase